MESTSVWDAQRTISTRDRGSEKVEAARTLTLASRGPRRRHARSNRYAWLVFAVLDDGVVLGGHGARDGDGVEDVTLLPLLFLVAVPR